MSSYSYCCFILGTFLRKVYIYKYSTKEKLPFLYCKMHFHLKKKLLQKYKGKQNRRSCLKMKLKMLVTDDKTPMCFRYLIRKLSQNRYFIDMVHRYTGKDLFIYVRNVRFIFPALIIRNSLSSCCSAEQYGTWGSYCT